MKYSVIFFGFVMNDLGSYDLIYLIDFVVRLFVCLGVSFGGFFCCCLSYFLFIAFGICLFTILFGTVYCKSF